MLQKEKRKQWVLWELNIINRSTRVTYACIPAGKTATLITVLDGLVFLIRKADGEMYYVLITLQEIKKRAY